MSPPELAPIVSFLVIPAHNISVAEGGVPLCPSLPSHSCSVCWCGSIHPARVVMVGVLDGVSHATAASASPGIIIVVTGVVVMIVVVVPLG